MVTATPARPPRASGEEVGDFILTATDGNTYSSKTARQNGLLLFILFKTGCGTCKLAFPYLQRFHEQYALPSAGKCQVWGISQNDAETTIAFAKEYGNATFPILLDTELGVSEEYRITNVPNLYLLGEDDAIAFAITGHFSADGYNEIAQKIAEFTGIPYSPIVLETDNAPGIKPG